MKNTHTPQPGCHIDSHHGHYAIPEVIRLAERLGYIVDPFLAYALDKYGADNAQENYPHEALISACDDAIDWLNEGRESERTERIPGQNWSPEIPEGHWWGWNDGDFGLYPEEDFEA